MKKKICLLLGVMLVCTSLIGCSANDISKDEQPMEVRHFTEENRADIAAHEGEEPEWIDWQYDGNTGNLIDK